MTLFEHKTNKIEYRPFPVNRSVVFFDRVDVQFLPSIFAIFLCSGYYPRKQHNRNRRENADETDHQRTDPPRSHPAFARLVDRDSASNDKVTRPLASRARKQFSTESRQHFMKLEIRQRHGDLDLNRIARSSLH